MTFATNELPTVDVANDALKLPLATFWQRLDRGLEWFGDQLNPILVKEARQALKSRQFTLTFSLLLIFGACWTALGVSWRMPAIFHSPTGPFMVVGYYVILAVPLLIVVPFAAFRSLAAEREDGTFELLSITSLTARQVVYGKLASAILQMIVYYSALAPCIAFTYLLRGLDIITIGLMLWYLFLASTILSSISLALATITKERHWQVLLSVLLVAGLVLVFWFWLLMMASMFGEFLNNGPYDKSEFWMFNLAVAMFHVSFVVLLVFTSSGQISFASDNRSSPVRWILLVQHALWFGWTYYVLLESNDYDEVLPAMMVVAIVYWWFAGSFLAGEKAEMSSRVRRQLPQSFLGRTLLTWFNPGSGTGYFFTLLNMGTVILAWFAITIFMHWQNGSLGISSLNEAYLRFFWAAWCYLAVYLGVGRLLLLAVRHRVPNGPVFSCLLQLVLLTFGVLIPLVLKLMLFGAYDNFDYSLLQITNPFWTLIELPTNYNSFADLHFAICTILAIFAFVLVMLHLWLTIREVEQTRVLAPQRVLQEDAALLAARQPAKRKNPWDVVPAGPSQ